MPRIEDVVVYCDEDADRQLFNTFKRLSPLLNGIADSSVEVYPQAPVARARGGYEKILPLFEYDRPDLIFTVSGAPVLVIEITEHAYTGDNGLQRFGRVASAAICGVPFIYFGPLSRVRDDELDLTDDFSSLSKRSLTSDFFEGMLALEKRFRTPQLFVEWETAENGKVRKIPLRADEAATTQVYGELARLIEVIVDHAVTSGVQSDLHSTAELTEARKRLVALAGKKNTLFSDVRFRFTSEEARQLIQDPGRLSSVLGDYFEKGKPDKLLAKFALERASVEVIRIGDSVVTADGEVGELLNRIVALPEFDRGSVGYYTGYKWRSDPHSGVAINLYFRMCCKAEEEELPLMIFYPRISILKSNAVALNNAARDAQGPLRTLFESRYLGNSAEKLAQTISSADLFSVWTPGTKQARVFSEYGTLVFCNDGLVLGKRLVDRLR